GMNWPLLVKSVLPAQRTFAYLWDMARDSAVRQRRRVVRCYYEPVRIRRVTTVHSRPAQYDYRPNTTIGPIRLSNREAARPFRAPPAPAGSGDRVLRRPGAPCEDSTGPSSPG